jgi:hypothetical protein
MINVYIRTCEKLMHMHLQTLTEIGAFNYKKLDTIADIFFSVDIVRKKI